MQNNADSQGGVATRFDLSEFCLINPPSPKTAQIKTIRKSLNLLGAKTSSDSSVMSQRLSFREYQILQDQPLSQSSTCGGKTGLPVFLSGVPSPSRSPDGPYLDGSGPETSALPPASRVLGATDQISLSDKPSAFPSAG